MHQNQNIILQFEIILMFGLFYDVSRNECNTALHEYIEFIGINKQIN